nr:AAA family ATPase [Thermoactinospora rubra]
MRPHLLTLTAFGSFPGTERVDFDALAEAGLFLVHGPTGAGKTTVLDALCFALYGQVPGQRNSARSLRCDHAPAGAGPSVTLEVTIRGRRLRVERSPAWQRPKLRGSGFTEEKAKVVLSELAGSTWKGLTTRIDEAGDLIGGLLGMNADQFCQVAMLPQGDFARFLRADGEERRKLLERLFTVKVFTQAEAWLAEHRKQAWRAQQELRRQVDFAVQRVAEAAGEELVAAVPPPEDEALPAWSGALLDAAGAVAERSGEQCESAAAALREARAAFDRGAALAELQRRHAEALTLRRTLDERAEERAELVAILDEAARADRVLPLVAGARHRAEAAAKTRALAADAIARARPLFAGLPSDPEGQARRAGGAVPDAACLARLERDRRGEIARLSELLTEEARQSVVRRDLARVEEELAELAAAGEEVDARLAELPSALEEAERELAAVRLAAARVPAAEAVVAMAEDLAGVEAELAALDRDLDRLAEREAEVATLEADLPAQLAEVTGRLAEVRARAAAVPAAAAARSSAQAVLEAARRRDTLAAELAAATADLRTLVDRAQASRERWLDIRQARLEGMAAELARELADGAPCPVCGSAEHPRPATPAPAAPSADDERAAEAAHEAALAEREAAERLAATLESRLTDAEAAAGGLDVASAEAALRTAEEELAALEATAALEPSLAAEAERVDRRREEAREQARELGEALAACRTRRSQLGAERDRLVSRLLEALPGGTDGGPDELLAAARAELDRLRQAASAEPDLAAEAARLDAERTRLQEEARRIAARLAACRTRREELSGDVARLTARLDAARGDDPTIAERLSRLSDEAELLREAVEATTAADTAAEEHAKAVRQAEEAALEAGFDDAAHAEAAARTPAEREAKAELLRELDARHAAVAATLADLELAAAAARPAPDLQALEAALAEAEREHTALVSARDRAAARERRLRELHDELGACLERWRPAAERHRLAERMASLAGGTSTDNQWSMSLSSYVLGERLRQVVDAANERLDHMSAGRYQLQHDLRKTAGSRARSGGGLGLRVADGWTGVDRDPATLSGGESFITSLALALGLADVVAAESGGAEIGMLFVDEGFGTLDEDTLDGVLDILDGLRDGGRAVGIVSHVGELRTRIPAQLKVTKTRTGSTLSVSAPG